MTAYNVERWEPFNDRERAAICVGLVGNVMLAVSERWPPERMASELKVTARLVSEINLAMGGDAVDADLMARLEELA